MRTLIGHKKQLNNLWREVAVDDSRFSRKGKKNVLIAGAHGLLLIVPPPPPPPPMRNRKEVFFPCRRVPPLLWTLYRRKLSQHFLLCKVITFLAFVIQSKIQRNIISIISFNALGEHAKGEDMFSSRCETATSTSEHSRKNIKSFITRLSHFVYICSKSARSLYDINTSFHNP